MNLISSVIYLKLLFQLHMLDNFEWQDDYE
jgi:hypothetical protein